MYLNILPAIQDYTSDDIEDGELGYSADVRATQLERYILRMIDRVILDGLNPFTHIFMIWLLESQLVRAERGKSK